MILQDLGRLEAVTVGFCEAFHTFHHLGGTEMRADFFDRPLGYEEFGERWVGLGRWPSTKSPHILA